MNASQDSIFAARNAELSAKAEMSDAHKGAYLIYWKKHYPLCYKLTGRYVVIDGTINLECIRNTEGATFWKATQGSLRFYGSLVMGDNVTVYREGQPVQADAEYIGKMKKIVTDQKALPGITITHTSVKKPVETSKPVIIAKSVQEELTALRTRLFAMFGVEGKVDSSLPIVRDYIALQSQAGIMKVSGFKQVVSTFKSKYQLA